MAKSLNNGLWKLVVYLVVTLLGLCIVLFDK